ncbi:unnamed protein product [Rhizoctonia solani]|uniref:MYND-type domain-containing protein n=1 Tax=Rhizoctonia solani TaxID=456999 RepID=A0A8H2XDB2_9AGAM|nr:unnamed protein product [Rhizoctonia solani]
MNALVPGRWGRPLEQYLPDYTEDRAFEELQAILAGHGSSEIRDGVQRVSAISLDHLDEPHTVTASTLRSLLWLALTPATYPQLASPALIRGCIALMSTIKPMGKMSPFSYELGYLCFRLITISIGACLLDNTGVHAFKSRIQELRPALVTPIVEGLIGGTGGRDRENCCCILGWTLCPRHAQAEVQLIVPLSDTRLLMEMLYTDRHLLLKSLISTHAPGLSAVVFLMWRYVNYQRFLQHHSLTNRLRLPVLEILSRCWLASTTDQHASFLRMYQWDKDLWPEWDDTKRIMVTPEDSRDILCAYTDHLIQNNTDPDYSKAITLAHFSNTMYFLAGRILPSSEDLLGPFFGALIERVWLALVGQEESNTTMAEGVGTMFNWLKAILKRLRHTWDVDPVTTAQIVNTLVRADILQLVGRTIFLLDPTLPTGADSPGFMANFKILHGTRELFEDISNMAPRGVVEGVFTPCFPSWWKVYRQFQFMARVVSPGNPTPRGNRWGFYDLCSDTWNNAMDTLSSNSAKKSRIMVACSYSRCPDPGILAGAEYSCSRCWIIKYCSPRCQALDWTNRNMTRSHSKLCLRYQTRDMKALEEFRGGLEFTGSAYS